MNPRPTNDVCARCGGEPDPPLRKGGQVFCSVTCATAPDRPSEPGRLKWPYPTEHCAADDCQKVLTEDDAAYLYKALFDKGLLSVFCDDCARYIELNFGTRWALVAL